MQKNDLSLLLKQIRRFEKENNENEGIRIAVLGSASIQYFVKILRYQLHTCGIDCQIYEGEFDGITMDVLDPNSALYRFAPEYLVLLPHYTDIKEYPSLLAPSEEISAALESRMAFFQKVWGSLSKISNIKVLQANFVIPPIREAGNLEYQLESTKGSFLRQVNCSLVEQKPPFVTVIDADTLSNDIGKYNWFDYSAYFLNKAPVRLDYLPELAGCFVRQILALHGKPRKCLVLDLDNTLWGGVVGDDGYNGLQLDPNNAVGEAYRFFQQYLLALKNRGVILAVCSKNEEAIAKEPFLKNENMILHLNDIACFVANWEDKASNIKRIAQELHIGTDSMVFFDDNPAERAIVRQFLPEVYVVEVPEDPADYALQLDMDSPFDWLQLTAEDLLRSDTYQMNQQRQEMRSSFVDYNSYLQALEMKGCVRELDSSALERFVQLINKSNQFNLRTVRYSEENITEMLKDPNTKCLYAQLEDKFSSFGIISCVILRKKANVCFIDTWVMSCRVLKRGVENMMFNSIIYATKKMGCDELHAEYIPTKKNVMVKDFYDNLGFQKKEGREEDTSQEYQLKNLDVQSTHYIKEELSNDKH